MAADASNTISGVKAVLCAVFMAAWALGGAACGSSTPPTPKEAVTNAGGINAAVTQGLVLALTDEPAQFVTYQVEITDVTLIGADGVHVQVFPLKTRADLSRYAVTSEYMSAATVPPGTYTGMTITVDYTDADLRVERADGTALVAGSIHDDRGRPLKKITIPVLMAHGPVVVARSRQAHVTLDFNLAASDAVDAGGRFADVTVVPVVTADVNPGRPKPYDARGAIKNVNVQHQAVQVYVRPFYRAIRRENNGFGSVTFHVDDHTVYDINRSVSTGPAGLKKLAQLTRVTDIEVAAEVDPATQRPTATEVRAGGSVPAVVFDALEGTVAARHGDTLLLRGVTFERNNGHIDFHDKATVKLSDKTRIVKAGEPYRQVPQDISVGQDISAMGDLHDRVMDTSTGFVRMLPTALHGAATDFHPLAVKLEDLGGHPPAVFDFSGTGTDAAHDVDPNHYVIDTGGLPPASTAASFPVAARGFVVPYGKAGDPADFTAHHHVRTGDAKDVAALSWRPPRADAVQGASRGSSSDKSPGDSRDSSGKSGSGASDSRLPGLTVKLDGLGAFHELVRGGVTTDARQLGKQLTLKPDGGAGQFVIVDAAGRSSFGRFGDFAAALERRLGGGAKVRHLVTAGHYDPDSRSQTVHAVEIRLEGGASPSG